MNRTFWELALLATLSLVSSCGSSGAGRDGGDSATFDLGQDGVQGDASRCEVDCPLEDAGFDVARPDSYSDLVADWAHPDAFPDVLGDGPAPDAILDVFVDWADPDAIDDLSGEGVGPDAIPDVPADTATSDTFPDLVGDGVGDGVVVADVGATDQGDQASLPDGIAPDLPASDVIPSDASDASDALDELGGGDVGDVGDVEADLQDTGESDGDGVGCQGSCLGKSCGDDGCGVSCGGCLAYEEECSDGICVAVPDAGVDLGNGVTSWPTRLMPGGTVTIKYAGILKDKSNLKMHYGFNGWNAIAGTDMATESDGEGNLNSYKQVSMVSAGAEGGYDVVISIPEQAKAIHFVFFSEEGTNKTWDNNGHKDWGREVLFPYIGPYLMWDAAVQESSTGVVVSFVTGHACAGTVEYGLTADLGLVASETDPGAMHRLVLYDLEPLTEYFYRVRCGVNASPLYTLRSGCALPESEGAGGFSFIVLGDAQEDGEHGRWRSTASTIRSDHQDVDFLISVGDMAWNDHPGLWWTYFDAARDLFASRVVMPVPGNHDTPTVGSNPDTTSFEYYFGLPFDSGSQTYYSFPYCGSRFAGLNSEWPDGFAKDSGEQFLWLSGLLDAAVGGATWAFAYWHVPPYNVGTRHPGAQGTFRDMTSLFAGRVDWVFGGHEHLYQRMKPISYNAQIMSGGYGPGVGQGVGYLLTPPSGAWPEGELLALDGPQAYYRDRLAYPVPPSNSNAVPSERGFVRIDISGHTLSMTTYGLGTPTVPVESHVVDTLQYSKP